jgi:hypothetical protein
MWLNKGDSQWNATGVTQQAILEDEGRTLTTDVRMDRVFLINGLFYGIEGMRVGGTRKLKIAPHLAYGEKGIPEVIPPNSVLTTEITIVAEAEVRGRRTTGSMPPDAA